jgi:putative peptidoglycan lipid II flippase
MNRAFYALQDTRTPLLTGILTLLLNLLFGTVFHRHTNLGAAGMALSYSIISTVNSILLLILLKRKMNGVDLRRLARFLLQSGLSAAAMGAILYLLEVLPLPSGSKAVQLTVLAAEIAAGVLVYLLMMLLLKNEDAQALVKRLKQGFHGRKS